MPAFYRRVIRRLRLLQWPSEEIMTAQWAAFMADQEWADLKTASAEAHGVLVGAIEDRVLRLTDCSRLCAARHFLIGCLVLFVGIGGLVSGFFLHALVGQPNEASMGTVMTVSGAVLMASALIVLVYGLITTPSLGAERAMERDDFRDITSTETTAATDSSTTCVLSLTSPP